MVLIDSKTRSLSAGMRSAVAPVVWLVLAAVDSFWLTLSYTFDSL